MFYLALWSSSIISTPLWMWLWDVHGRSRSRAGPGCSTSSEAQRAFSRYRLPCAQPISISSSFQTCLATGRLKTAASYLLVLHTLEQLDGSSIEAIRLLRIAMSAGENQLCCDLLRFLRSIDDSGDALRQVVTQAGIIELESSSEEVAVNGNSLHI